MNATPHALHHLRPSATWLIVFGALLVLVGIAAVVVPWIFTLAGVLVFGWLLLLGGLAGTVGAILSRGWHGFAVYLAIGVLDIVVGFLIVTKPLQTAEVATLILSVLFLAGGFGRIISAAVMQFPHWGSAVLGGFISVVLGAMIWAEWPASSLWVIGTFIGIEMIFRGTAWMALGMAIRRRVPTGASDTSNGRG